MIRNNVAIQITIASTSGTLYRCSNLSNGNNNNDMKNAITIGMITPCPVTISTPSAHSPSNSIDRRTVSGSSFIYLLLVYLNSNYVKKTLAMLLPAFI
jgi:hypothetical protein